MDTRFYCDKCGKDVAFNTEVCPYCGETFDAVKCPVCKLIGKPSLFIGGCPSCGFMNPKQDIATPLTHKAQSKKPQKKAPKQIYRKKQKLFFNIPAYWYRILIAVFIMILIGLLYLLYRLY